MSDVTRRSVFAGAAAIGASAAPTIANAAQTDRLLVDPDRMPDLSIDLWPDEPPGGDSVALEERYVERENRFNLRDRALHDVTRPRLDVFYPEEPDGSAILIMPGGGYRWVVVDKEGYEGARWFSRKGATVYALMYRLPHQGWAAGPDTPLQDAQRAMRIIRGRARTDRVDSSKIMALGFSAGGHVAGSLATRFNVDAYTPVDDADALSARPDLAALIYPVATMDEAFTHGDSRRNMIGAAPTDENVKKYSVESAPPADTPPIFLLHATDDASVPVENSTNLYSALRSAGVSSAMHVFASGGHGFGLRGIDETPLRRWPTMLLDWSAQMWAIGAQPT